MTFGCIRVSHVGLINHSYLVSRCSYPCAHELSLCPSFCCVHEGDPPYSPLQCKSGCNSGLEGSKARGQAASDDTPLRILSLDWRRAAVHVRALCAGAAAEPERAAAPQDAGCAGAAPFRRAHRGAKGGFPNLSAWALVFISNHADPRLKTCQNKLQRF